jgi:hypothetical protein
LAVVAVAAAVPASARAAITVGSDLSQAGGPDYCTGSGPGDACTILQLTLGTTDQAVPVDGTITSWAVRDASGSLALQVIDGPAGQRHAVATGPTVQGTGSGVQSFPVSIPVTAGQRVGVQLGADAQVPIRYRDPQTTGERYDPPLGAAPALPISTDISSTYELLYNATIQPAAGAGCPTSGIVARGSGSVVYRTGKRLTACRAGTNTTIGTRSAHTQFRLFRFNADALALVRVVDHKSFVDVYDLAAGRRTFTTKRTFSRGQRTQWTVRSLVVATNGDGAWISTLRGHSDRTTVWIRAGRKVQQIDSGRIRPLSLKLSADGRSITYRGADGKERNSGLD